jgi:hypothetical protein
LNAWLEAHRAMAIAVTLLIAAIPAWFALSWVLRYGVEIPSKDDWAMAPIIIKAQTGQLTFHDLFEQQQEARTILPKLIYIASAVRGYWDVRPLLILSVVVCVATAIGIYWLLLGSGLSLAASAVCFWLIALAIFSATQFELWVWAAGFPSFMPALFLVFALCVLEMRVATWIKFVTCALCSIAASFTLAHGLLLWGLTFPFLLLGQRLPRWPRWLCAWLALTITCAAVYFYGYTRPAYHPEFAPPVPLLNYARYLLAFLGGEFAFATRGYRMLSATIAGVVLLTLYLAAALIAWLRRVDAQLWQRALPWIALGAYSIGSGCLATPGRIGFGMDSALASRYVTFSLYLTVAVIVLIPLMAKHVPRFRIIWLALITLLTVPALVVSAFAEMKGVEIMARTSARTRLLRSAVLFSQVLPTSEAMRQENPFPPPADIRSISASLDERKLLRPPLIRSVELAPLRPIADQKIATGKCDAIWAIDGERSRASGFALLKTKRRPADAVLLAYETAERGLVAFALSEAVSVRRDVVHRARDAHQLWSGWTATFANNAVPAGAKISAWALDAEIPQLYRLADPGN